MNKKRLPNYYWLDENGNPKPTFKLLYYIFKASFPNFRERRETVSSEMVKEVTKKYNDASFDFKDIRNTQIWYPIRYAFDRRLESVSESKYDLYDEVITQL